MDNSLPAGLIDDNIEFFKSDDLQAYKIRISVVVPFDAFSNAIVDHIYQQVAEKYPVKLSELMNMNLPGKREMVKQALLCNYGNFDNKPDLIAGELQKAEFVRCSKRGSCKHEGKLCENLITDTGERLTPKEVKYLELTAKGLLDKEIAQHLNISPLTVATHNRNTRRKTGCAHKSDLTRFAIQKQLI